jgi:lipopolysaccharide/colanic/teichoic acid biosynthesis glycosyltransferase
MRQLSIFFKIERYGAKNEVFVVQKFIIRSKMRDTKLLNLDLI